MISEFSLKLGVWESYRRKSTLRGGRSIGRQEQMWDPPSTDCANRMIISQNTMNRCCTLPGCKNTETALVCNGLQKSQIILTANGSI